MPAQQPLTDMARGGEQAKSKPAIALPAWHTMATVTAAPQMDSTRSHGWKQCNGLPAAPAQQPLALAMARGAEQGQQTQYSIAQQQRAFTFCYCTTIRQHGPHAVVCSCKARVSLLWLLSSPRLGERQGCQSSHHRPYCKHLHCQHWTLCVVRLSPWGSRGADQTRRS